jgi:hypothetical protein
VIVVDPLIFTEPVVLVFPTVVTGPVKLEVPIIPMAVEDTINIGSANMLSVTIKLPTLVSTVVLPENTVEPEKVNEPVKEALPVLLPDK